MATQAILISWIGYHDILALAQYGMFNHKEHLTSLAKQIWIKYRDEKGLERIKEQPFNSSTVEILKQSGKGDIPSFSKIILLENYRGIDSQSRSKFHECFKKFITKNCNTSEYQYDDRIDILTADDVDAFNFKGMYSSVKSILNAKIAEENLDPKCFYYNLMPGRSTQGVVFVLIGKEFAPNSSQFILIERKKSPREDPPADRAGEREFRIELCEIPFDIYAANYKQAESIENLPSDPNSLIGKSKSFCEALEIAKLIAKTPHTVLLLGESGTGKEGFARAIHDLSGLKGDFVPVNCAQLNKSTGLSAFTGYYKGAFTGADETTEGYFHMAKGGTLFLDEIGECPPDVQSELLRFLQPPKSSDPSKRYWRLMGAEPKKCPPKYKGEQDGEIRVIAATNRNLQDPNLNFRQDLYYRIETFQITLPSLKKRIEERDPGKGIDDLKDLADKFLQRHKTSKFFTPDAYEALKEHDWPGNIRELQNVITRVAVLSSGAQITGDDIKRHINRDTSAPKTKGTSVNPSAALEELARSPRTPTLKEFRQLYCQAILNACDGNKTKARKLLDVTDQRTLDNYLSS